MKYQERAIKRIVEIYAELPEAAKRKVIDDIRYQSIMQAAEEVNKTHTVCFGDLYADAMERQKYFNSFEGFGTGLKYFDDATMGFRPGEVVVIAGPTNYGKTTVALNAVVSAITHSRKKVLVISMEMRALEIASRVYNMTDDHDALMENLIIQTELSVNTKHIAAMIERHHPDMLMLDHIQFLANQEDGKEYERITAATAKFKRLAIDYSLPAIAISHVGRSRSGKNGEADVSDLKGSSSIEQDCDIGIMINRQAEQEIGNEITLKLFKHRTKRPLVFHKACVLSMDGVRIVDRGNYYVDDAPQQPRKESLHKELERFGW